MRNKWNKEIIQNITLKYKTKNEFKIGHPNAYNSAKKHKWINDVCGHMVCGRKYWTKDKIFSIAKKYDSVSEFKKMELVVYKRASSNGWLPEICKHMVNSGNKHKRLVYVYEFPDNHVYIGLTYNEKIRNSQHQKYGPVYEHIKLTKLKPNKEILSNGYIDVNDAIELEIELIIKYRNNNWIILNKMKGGGIGGGGHTKQTIEKIKKICHNEALKYNFRNELKKGSPRIYDKIKRHKWLDELCSHMEYKYKKKEKV